jgi:hypothetical protein
MTFAELRQAVLQGGALNPDFFAEEATIQVPGIAQGLTVRCKITHTQATTARGPQIDNDGSLDEYERIAVLVSRDPSQPLSLPQKPAVGTHLFRSVSRDTDRRPFAFSGEVQFEGDQHAVYVFARPRRVAQGRR